MEKASEIPASPWDVFLLPVWIHKKLSLRLQGLIIAFLLVGIFDMLFFQDIVRAGFFNADVPVIILRTLGFLVFSFLAGVIDIICTMVPISEFAIMIGKRSEKFVSKGLPVVLMKSYALSHIIFVLPTAIYTYAGVDWANVNVASANQIRWLFSILIVFMRFMPYIQLGIIYRTLSVRTRIQVFGKLILVLATYFWMQLSSGAIYFFVALFQRILVNQ